MVTGEFGSPEYINAPLTRGSWWYIAHGNILLCWFAKRFVD